VKAEVGKLYEHYKKGTLYAVLNIARHTEVEEELVIYKEIKTDGLGKIWARPRKMFEEMIIVDGKKVHRFKKHTTKENDVQT